MKDDLPQSEKPPEKPRSKPGRQTRKLSLRSRVRDSFRRGADRILGADHVWSVAFVIVVVLLVGAQRCGTGLGDLSLGDVATTDVKAPFDFLDVQQGRTTDLRRTAMDGVAEVYVYDTERGPRLARQLSGLFGAGRQAFEQAGLAGTDPSVATHEALRGQLPAPAIDALIAAKFDRSIERELKTAVTQAMDGRIVASKSLLELQTEILLRRVPEELEGAGRAVRGLQ